jgi:alkylation response protein AidB-like acyl-CoA dehydrogenase
MVSGLHRGHARSIFQFIGAAVTTLTHVPSVSAPEAILSEEMLTRFRQRAAAYDRENRFFHEDFAELVAAGYLKLAIPRDLGGYSLSLALVAEQQRRLACMRACDGYQPGP